MLNTECFSKLRFALANYNWKLAKWSFASFVQTGFTMKTLQVICSIYTLGGRVVRRSHIRW